MIPDKEGPKLPATLAKSPFRASISLAPSPSPGVAEPPSAFCDPLAASRASISF